VQFALTVPADLRWLEGHFTEEPILAAVVQVREVLGFVREDWPDLPAVSRIKRAKFRQPIRPLDRLTLRLKRKTDAPLVTFEYARDGEVCSGGSLEFE